MKPAAKLIVICLVVFVGLLLLGLGVSWFGAVSERPMEKYREETRTQVYDNSRQFQQGINRDIARYCQQMRTEQNAAGKKALANLIGSTMSTYEGPLNPGNQDCVSEAKGI